MTQLRLTSRQRQDRARVIVTASKKTGDILPRHIYERAGAPVPHNATDELQRAEHWLHTLRKVNSHAPF